MSKFTLYQNWFLTGKDARDSEYKECLSRNCKNTLITKIVLLCENKSLTCPFDCEKIDFRYVDKRPSYQDFFNLSNSISSVGEISILSNTDIYFDESLNNLNKYIDDKTVIALTRYENGAIGETEWSQDVWIWKNKINHKNMFCDFYMGILGCDNRIAFELSKNYTVLNPCLDIRTHHIHKSQIRTYGKERIPRPYKELFFNFKDENNLFQVFKDFRGEYEGPAYPPYHQGDYFEEYFSKFYFKHLSEFEKTGYRFIPVFWTNMYLSKTFNDKLLQEKIDAIEQDVKYFVVSQHDDAIKEVLPPKTIHFNMGGNSNTGIPTPLICSPIHDVKQDIKRDILCSFVGSNTHYVRNKIIEMFKDSTSIVVKSKQWEGTVSSSDMGTFIDITKRSKFCLCPRGYGKNSFRLSESLQLGAIPVYVYDGTPFLPFDDEIDYNKFCVLVEEKNLFVLEETLSGYSDEKIKQMVDYGNEVWNKYFSMEGCCFAILDKLMKIKNECVAESTYYVSKRVRKVFLNKIKVEKKKQIEKRIFPIYAPWRT